MLKAPDRIRDCEEVCQSLYRLVIDEQAPLHFVSAGVGDCIHIVRPISSENMDAGEPLTLEDLLEPIE